MMPRARGARVWVPAISLLLAYCALATKVFFLLFFFFRLTYLMFLSVCLHVCTCMTCMPGAHRGQKKALAPPDLELVMIMSHHVGARTRT